MKKKLISILAAAFLCVAPILTLALDADESLETATITVEGMTCGGCVGAVKVQLKRTPGVKDYEVSLEKGEAEVVYDLNETTPQKIAESITKSGFKGTVKEPDDKT